MDLRGWRRWSVGVVLVAMLVAATGCGSAAQSEDAAPSEAPDAVATADTAPSAESTDSGAAAEVKVEGSGFSLGDYEEVGYGLVLKNTSATMDAKEVQITVNLLSKSGAVLTTEDTTLNLIPAGKTFYFGSSTYVDKGDKPKKMEAFVDVGTSDPAEYQLPNVSHVRLVNAGYGSISVKGQVKNELQSPISMLARIGCVLSDADDKVVGGGFGYLDANLPTGRTAAVEILNGPSATPWSKIERAEVSMDNAVE